MAAAGPMLLDEAGRLQRLFHETVGHRDPVLPLRNLMKGPHIEPRIALAIEPQHLLDVPGRHPAPRRAQEPLINQPALPVGFVALAPAPQRPGRPA
jgi:hypothetical protein